MERMPARVVTLSPPGLAARFAAAAGREPLCALPAGAAAELAALLGEVTELEDLPGKWQAALLTAEGPSAPAGGAPRVACRHCG
jgi:hypothetical protein